MTEAKHTPGPWIKDGMHWYGSDVSVVVVSDGPSFCSASCHESAKANALLIAAAPELLEALQESETLSELQFKMRLLVSRRRKGIAGIESDGDELAVEWRNVKSRADAIATRRFNAIAKATGK